jgi:hypothetical protein
VPCESDSDTWDGGSAASHTRPDKHSDAPIQRHPGGVHEHGDRQHAQLQHDGDGRRAKARHHEADGAEELHSLDERRVLAAAAAAAANTAARARCASRPRSVHHALLRRRCIIAPTTATHAAAVLK